MTQHMRDPGYAGATGEELFRGGHSISEALRDTIFRRALCSLKWRESRFVTNAWQRVKCRDCKKKRGKG